MRQGIRISIGLAIGACVFASLVPAYGQERLEVSPSIAHPGSKLIVSGSGCSPGAKTQFDLSSPGASATGSVLVGATGQFSALVTVPRDIRPGRAQLTATCQGDDGDLRSLQATVLVERPAMEITGVNVLFGLGAFLITCGLGIAVRRGSRSSSRRTLGRDMRVDQARKSREVLTSTSKDT